MNNSFILTWDHFDECRNTIKQILWMYHDMTRMYGGFGHNIDFEPIDYKRFLFTEVDEGSISLHAKEAEILRQGALSALGCDVVNLLDEAQRRAEVYDFINSALASSLLHNRPFDQEVLSAMKRALDEQADNGWESMPDGARLVVKLAEVYDCYVLGYYEQRMNEMKL
ncbi:hypothetical protein KP77_34290 [Jeotgalibacillus alimentarius]|uniref:Uncharacterized protein n=1 Tax=Jeotgalibacillus alimentarius TaxID=135826 RepID=A0A0C2RM01_9BACL|nr:hypothetical protein [Jeotgalibacillus alimentarius]KIL42799.1 hypothetical protein KP77_34290 [Jeotgalibacillus alimentarius]